MESMWVEKDQKLGFGYVEQEMIIRHLSRDIKDKVKSQIHEIGILEKDSEMIQIPGMWEF